MNSVALQDALVSVIIPTKNRPLFLAEAIRSVYAQTYQNVEIIVVNDGGVDVSCAEHDARLRYFRQDAAGVSAARNYGLREARGEFIAFLDDDDVFLPDRLMRGVAHMKHHPDTAWLCSGFSFIDGAGNACERPAIIHEKPDVTLHDIALFLFIHTSSVMVRRKSFILAGGFSEGLAVSEDYDAWARALAIGKGVAIQEILTCWRLHGGNTKLPFRVLLKNNTRIIDYLVRNHSAKLQPRQHYIDNLHRIIGENLIYQCKFWQYRRFKLHLWLCRLFAFGR